VIPVRSRLFVSCCGSLRAPGAGPAPNLSMQRLLRVQAAAAGCKPAALDTPEMILTTALGTTHEGQTRLA
jgi:hypothetical protein